MTFFEATSRVVLVTEKEAWAASGLMTMALVGTVA